MNQVKVKITYIYQVKVKITYIYISSQGKDHLYIYIYIASKLSVFIAAEDGQIHGSQKKLIQQEHSTFDLIPHHMFDW